MYFHGLIVHLFLLFNSILLYKGFPCGSAGKESTSNAGDLSSIPGLGRSLEQGKATHSSILAWRIPWTVKSMGSQRVEHDWATFTFHSFLLTHSDEISIPSYLSINGKNPGLELWSQSRDFPGGSAVKNMPASAGDVGSIPMLGRSPRKGNGNPLLYSCLGHPMDRGACWGTVHGVAKGWKWLSN